MNNNWNNKRNQLDLNKYLSYICDKKNLNDNVNTKI